MDRDLATLRTALNATNHVGRLNRMLELGREAHHDPRARQLIDGLWKGDVFDRRMALLAQHTLSDGARVLEGTRDVARSLRLLAFALVAQACDDMQALEALKIAFTLRREADLLRELARAKRRPVVDRYLDWLADQPGVPDFADFVPFGTAASIARHLPRALLKPSKKFWARMNQSAPASFALLLADRLRAVPGEPDAVTRQLIAQYTPAIIENAPDEGSVLLELLVARGIKAYLGTLSMLGRTRPRRALELIERYDLVAPPAIFEKSARDLSDDELARIVRREPQLLGAVDRLEKHISSAQLNIVVRAWSEVAKKHVHWGFALIDRLEDRALRKQVYEWWSVAARSSDGTIAGGMVEKLPPDLRELEGRRHMHEVVALATRPAARIAYARYLPWDEADAAIKAYLGHPEGSMRSSALAVLLAIPGLRPAETELADRALAMVIARKNEQDPVRATVLNALASWPKKIWRARHAKIVAQILRDALDAGDLSHGTAQIAERLLLRTFFLDAELGASQLATFIKERGQIYDARIGAHLSDDDVKVAAPHLLAVAKAWSVRERVYQLAQLAESLGDRLRLVPGLSDVLVRAMNEAAWGGVALALLMILKRFDARRFEEVLSKTLGRWFDMGWQSEILQLASDRGKLGKLGRRPPPPHAEVIGALEKIARGHGRNEHIYAALTLLRLRDVKRFDTLIGELLAKDESYVCIPVVHWQLHKRRQELLTPFLGARVIKGRFATGNTAWLLPFDRDFHRWTVEQNALFASSLAAVTNDMGRDTPAVWRCTKVMAAMDSAPMNALAALADDQRPAVQERAIRVMARCDRAQCVPKLLECLGDARARIAIYGFRKAVKDLLPSRALEILSGVPMAKVTVAKEIVRLYGELRAEPAYLRLLELDQTKLHRDVRIALLRALWDHLDREPTWDVFARAVTADDWVMASRLGDIPADRLTEKSDRRLSALLARVLDRPEPEARIDLLQRAAVLSVSDPERTFLRACSARLRSLYDDEVRAAMAAIMNRSTEKDLERLPELIAVAMEDARCLHVAIASMVALPIRTRASWIGAVRAAETVLARDRRWAALRVQCAAAAMNGRELAEHVARLGDEGLLGFDALDACRTAVTKLRRDEAAAFGERLQKSAVPEVRRVAVWALLHDSEPGWSEERLALLATLQSDVVPMVAGAAAAIAPPRVFAGHARVEEDQR